MTVAPVSPHEPADASASEHASNSVSDAVALPFSLEDLARARAARKAAAINQPKPTRYKDVPPIAPPRTRRAMGKR